MSPNAVIIEGYVHIVYLLDMYVVFREFTTATHACETGDTEWYTCQQSKNDQAKTEEESVPASAKTFS